MSLSLLHRKFHKAIIKYVVVSSETQFHSNIGDNYYYYWHYYVQWFMRYEWCNFLCERYNFTLFWNQSFKLFDYYGKKIDEKKQELKDLSNKFRELKSLVFDYKKEKEQEINQLVNQQNNFKKEIEKNKEDYDKIIDDAADQIENFVQKINSENSIQ